MSGHERTCEQCGSNYHSPRASSRFCSGACRVRHHRGAAKGDPRLRSWLLKRGFVGKLSSTDKRGQAGESLGLTLPLAHALAELNAATGRIQARGLQSVLPTYTEGSLKAALRALNVAA